MNKKWYRSKTIWLNLIAFVLSVIAQLQQIDMNWEYFTIMIAVLNIAMRFITADPIGIFEEYPEDKESNENERW